MRTVWLFGALCVAMSVTGAAHAEETRRESGDPHFQMSSRSRSTPFVPRALGAGGAAVSS